MILTSKTREIIYIHVLRINAFLNIVFFFFFLISINFSPYRLTLIFFYLTGRRRGTADRVSSRGTFSRFSLIFFVFFRFSLLLPFSFIPPFRGIRISASRITRSIVSRAVGVFTTGVMRVYAASAFRIACVQP